jgi:hypothetical protein
MFNLLYWVFCYIGVRYNRVLYILALPGERIKAHPGKPIRIDELIVGKREKVIVDSI